MKLTGNTRRHRWVAILTTSVLVITASAALADELTQIDGDTATNGNQNPITLSGDACADEASFPADVRLQFNANRHYDANTNVIVAGSADAGSGITVTGSTTNIGTWANGSSKDLPFTVTIPTATVDGNYTVSVTTTGSGYDVVGGQGGPTNVPLSGPYVLGPITLGVTVDCGRVAGGNSAPDITDFDLTRVDACTVEADVEWTDDEGDTHTVTFAWGDDTDDTVVTDAESRTAEQHTYGAAGTYTVKATVTDQDSASDDASDTFDAYNTPSAVLQPINGDGSSLFKIKSTIPVKITVTGCDGEAVTSLSPTIALVKTAGDVAAGDLEVVSSSAADSGNVMRWSADGQQYIYNLATKSRTMGTYKLTISDGSFAEDIVATFGLR